MVNKYITIHLLGFISKVIRKIKIPKYICKNYNDMIHHHIEKILNPYFKETYKNIKNDNNYSVGKNSNIIWMFWWQGINNAPLIVKKCIKSIVHYSNGHRVIIINRNNIHKYTNIPNYIYKKLTDHIITFTHFSDILRFNVLKNYGGLWIDSTIYCTSYIKNKFPSLYTSGGYEDPYHFFVSSKWTGFLIGGNKDNIIFAFMDEFFRLYWKYNNSLIDYFLIDYALEYVYKQNIGDFKYYVDYTAWKNNPHLHDLQSLLNSKYNKNIYSKLTSDTNFFKLTYKKRFKDNGKTFYSKIIDS